MKFATKRINSECSQVAVDGHPIPVFIEKGDDPEFGAHREWHVFYDNGETLGADMIVYRRKSDALDAIQKIWMDGYAAGATSVP